MSGEVILREWQTVGPDDDEGLAHVCPFTADEAEFAAELGRSQRLEVLEVRGGLRVSTRSYVGTVRIGSTTLQIRPKFGELSPAAMAAFLRYALGMSLVRHWDTLAGAPLEQRGIGDLIALALLDEVNALFRAGLLQGYQTQSSWRDSPRGHLDLTEFARNPMHAWTAPALPCRVSEHVFDTTLNRVVRATLATARLLVTDPDINSDLSRRAALLGELCQIVPLTRALLVAAGTALDRRSWHYQPVLAMAALILQGLGVTVDSSARRTPLSSFLLDMNVLFERFVSRLLLEYGPHTMRVETQMEAGTAYWWKENPYRWQRPRLRPDITLYDTVTGRPSLILDAKYKPLGAARRPSPEDLYQLTLYSLSSGVRHIPARIVYPEVANLTALPVPCLDFRGLSGRHTMASVSFCGIPMLSITAALQSQDDPALRRMVGSITNVAPS